MLEMKGTTILCVRRGDEVVIGGDGQATLGNTVAKDNIIKVRKLSNGKVLTGFAGSTADAFTLFEKFEQKLDFYQGNLERASVEMVREWRLDRMMSKLEAMIIVADENKSLLISGVGDVMAADEKGILSIGSGSAFAKAAAHALVDNTELSAYDIVKKSLNIAADICIYTNHNLTIEKLANKAAI
ncbi:MULTISPECIES: ATP-dependent protease subunit HslV [Cysteiniphilum]|uniref:ATP-dependent protease subunit HslV n=1 Tax=Cysteiniphilum litorale TaxID=2056700 RepID=A0A8J2Z333_9GAMM|nr:MULTISPECIES: ATP-dependent protease subunit HslV [Cysteiniphilum]GGF89465.1 ATP-dependent protease subunit HslV [Cysteiniphilum litorale]